MKKLINAVEQAKLLAVSTRTLRGYVANGFVPAVKLPGAKFSNGHHLIDRGTLRFDPDAVAAALTRYTVNAPRQPHRRAGRTEPAAA
jgi:hypothetical protein